MYFNFIPIDDTDKHNYVMNGLVTDSMQMGADCWALSSLHPPPTPSIYDRIP